MHSVELMFLQEKKYWAININYGDSGQDGLVSSRAGTASGKRESSSITLVKLFCVSSVYIASWYFSCADLNECARRFLSMARYVSADLNTMQVKLNDVFSDVFIDLRHLRPNVLRCSRKRLLWLSRSFARDCSCRKVLIARYKILQLLSVS